MGVMDWGIVGFDYGFQGGDDYIALELPSSARRFDVVTYAGSDSARQPEVTDNSEPLGNLIPGCYCRLNLALDSSKAMAVVYHFAKKLWGIIWFQMKSTQL